MYYVERHPGLSNTAVPKYYGEFRDAVMRGDIPVCKEISMQMNRIDARIDNPDYWYDENAIEGFVKYCENELTYRWLTTYIAVQFQIMGRRCVWLVLLRREIGLCAR